MSLNKCCKAMYWQSCHLNPINKNEGAAAGVFQLPPGWDASPSQRYSRPSPVHLCTLIERSTVRVKCVAQEHNSLGPLIPR